MAAPAAVMVYYQVNRQNVCVVSEHSPKPWKLV